MVFFSYMCPNKPTLRQEEEEKEEEEEGLKGFVLICTRDYAVLCIHHKTAEQLFSRFY